MGSPRVRLNVARILIVLASCIGVVAAVSGVWLTTAAMALVVTSQVLVYGRAKRDIDEPE